MFKTRKLTISCMFLSMLFVSFYQELWLSKAEMICFKLYLLFFLFQYQFENFTLLLYTYFVSLVENMFNKFKTQRFSIMKVTVIYSIIYINISLPKKYTEQLIDKQFNIGKTTIYTIPYIQKLELIISNT